MKTIVILMALTLVGCGQWNRTQAKFIGYTKTCVDGVSYLQFPSGATVQVNPSGLPVPCER